MKPEEYREFRKIIRDLADKREMSFTCEATLINSLNINELENYPPK